MKKTSKEKEAAIKSGKRNFDKIMPVLKKVLMETGMELRLVYSPKYKNWMACIRDVPTKEGKARSRRWTRSGVSPEDAIHEVCKPVFL